MSQSPTRKIFKFVLVLGLLAAIIFVGIKFLFPVPNRFDVYNKTFALTENQSENTLSSVSTQIITLMNARVDDETLNNLIFYKLMTAQNIFLSMQKVHEFTIYELGYAKNSNIYNLNAKQINALYSIILEKYTQIDTYIDNQITPFLASETKTTQSLNSYASAILNFQVDICDMYLDYTLAVANIYYDLENNFSKNEWSNGIVKISTNWSIQLYNMLKNNENTAEVFEQYQTNATGLTTFTGTNLNISVSKQFYTNTTIANLSTDISKTNIVEIVKNAFTNGEQIYIDTLTTEQQAIAQRIFAFVKGVE